MSLIKRYARFVSHRPLYMLMIVIAVTIAAFILSSQVGTKSSDNRDALPEDIDVIEAFNKIEDNFGGSDSIMIAVEIDPLEKGLGTIRDVRDPDIIEYVYLISSLSEHTDDVISVTSASSLLKEANSGTLPKTKARVIDLMQDVDVSSYISPDYTMSVISIRLSDTYSEEEIVEDLQEVIEQVKIPSGLSVSVAGDVATGPVMQQTIGPDMAKTSRFSMIGILLVLFLLFMSVRYALTPLIVIGIGILWAFGFFGAIGIDISPMTSGAISMIMGIGIDFGIQIITRFRHELKGNKPEEAMEVTLTNVFMPMFTTTLAALIGFQAMSIGKLTFLGELGTIMSYGVLFCFLSAISVVPIISIYGERIFSRKKILMKKKNMTIGDR